MNPTRRFGHPFLVSLIATTLLVGACGTPSTPGTNAPGPVTSLQAVASDASVTLTWTDPTDADLGAIRITRTPSGTTESVDAGVETFTYSGLTNGTEYSFSVRAINAAGIFSTPTVVTATPPGTTASCTAPVDLLDADVDGGVALVSGTCYRVSSAITVSGGTLTIPNDVIVEFTDMGSMVVAVGAALTVDGTAGSPVVFRGTEAIKGYWRGIRIQSNSLANILSHAVIRDAGASPWTGSALDVAALYLLEGRVSITDSTFTNNAGTGIQAFANATFEEFSANVFYANDVPMWLHPDRVGELDGSSSFSQGGVENVGQYVQVTHGNNDAVTGAQTWPALTVPYRVMDRTFVNAPLTVAPGAVLEFDQSTSLYVNVTGTLDLTGTPSEPIELRGIEPIRGYWKGIRITSDSAQNVFDHVVLRDAGESPWSGDTRLVAALFLMEGRVAVTDSTFTNNAGYGVQALANATFGAFSNNTFTENDAPMWLDPDRVGEIDDTNSFLANDDQFVRVTFGNNDAVSTAQTWPALTVPYRVSDRTFVRAPLTIAAGATLEFDQDVEFIVTDLNGALTIAGTTSERVRLVGSEDLVGYWRGILIQTASASNSIANATISNGGGTGGETQFVFANVEVQNGSLALVGFADSVEVTDSGGHGLYVGGSTLTGCIALTGSNNASGTLGSSTSTTDCP